MLIQNTAITVNAEPCWIVTNADGSPTGFEDSEPHYGTEEEARRVAQDLTSVGDPAPIVKRLDGVCASATMACGYRYDEDDEGIQHWPDTAEEFRRFLTVTMEYRTGARGALLCPADQGCEDCDGLATPLEAAEMSGQLDLPIGANRPNPSQGGEDR